jgi:hypothetical protein
MRTWYLTCNCLLEVWYQMETVTESTLEIYRKTANHGTVVRPTFQPSHGFVVQAVISKTYDIPLPWSVGCGTGGYFRRFPRVQGIGVNRNVAVWLESPRKNGRKRHLEGPFLTAWSSFGVVVVGTGSVGSGVAERGPGLCRRSPSAGRPSMSREILPFRLRLINRKGAGGRHPVLA